MPEWYLTKLFHEKQNILHKLGIGVDLTTTIKFYKKNCWQLVHV